MFDNLIRPIRTSILALALSAPMAAAQDMPAPTGDVLLTVTGAIEKTNAEGALMLDAALLESLPQRDRGQRRNGDADCAERLPNQHARR
jgi:hypothetical protein